MMNSDFMFTSESVTAGHPDKLCDRISDEIVDHFLRDDPTSRVRAECAVSSGVIFLAARYTSSARPDLAETARSVVADLGYTEGKFNATDCTVMTSLIDDPATRQRPLDVRALDEQGIDRVVAANQVTVFGFACNQTQSLMPLPITLAHALARRLAAVRAEGTLPYLSPDGKTQVGVEYRGQEPWRIYSVTVIAAQHEAGSPSPRALHDDVVQAVIEPVFEGQAIALDPETRIFVNPDGPFVGGGPAVHSGLTGRKNAIDTYGEFARHSGAALSGKDPMRIDRVGAYAARHAAKNVVAAGLAEQCELQLSYSIGQAQPVSVQVRTFGTGKLDERAIARRVTAHFDFRPAGIVRKLDLQTRPPASRKGLFAALAAYGHMGRTDLALPWERIDEADDLR
jgi:S-adenosylmethionine synthetase